MTGDATTPHLHFQIDKDDAPYHPYWPYTFEDCVKAGVDFFAAVDIGLGKDNAIKYTPTGFVKVELKTDAGKAFITVSDSGLGIPASLLPFLFEEFIRDERVKKEIRGTGLGLYIARKITEAHGGTLSAKSPGEEKGSTFKATIPLTP